MKDERSTSEILQRALNEKQQIDNLQAELRSPFIEAEQARQLRYQLDLANVYHIQEAARRGIIV